MELFELPPILYFALQILAPLYLNTERLLWSISVILPGSQFGRCFQEESWSDCRPPAIFFIL